MLTTFKKDISPKAYFIALDNLLSLPLICMFATVRVVRHINERY